MAVPEPCDYFNFCLLYSRLSDGVYHRKKEEAADKKQYDPSFCYSHVDEFSPSYYAWLTILGKNGIINTILNSMGFGSLNLIYNNGAVVLGMVYNFLPFMVLPIYSVLIKMDKNLVEAAEDLGASKVTVFKKVVFPLSLPGVMTGFTMVFTPAVSTFIISNLLGGNKTNLMGNVIEQQFMVTGDWHFGSAISLILMLIILIVMAVSNKNGNDVEGGKGTLW